MPEPEARGAGPGPGPLAPSPGPWPPGPLPGSCCTPVGLRKFKLRIVRSMALAVPGPDLMMCLSI